MSDIQIQFTTLDDFKKLRGFLINKIPAAYQLSEAEAWHSVEESSQIPSQLKAVLSSYEGVKIFALAPTDTTPHGFVVVGLPQ